MRMVAGLSKPAVANDTALVTDSEEKLCRLVSEIGRVCKRKKLIVHLGN